VTAKVVYWRNRGVGWRDTLGRLSAKNATRPGRRASAVTTASRTNVRRPKASRAGGIGHNEDRLLNRAAVARRANSLTVRDDKWMVAALSAAVELLWEMGLLGAAPIKGWEDRLGEGDDEAAVGTYCVDRRGHSDAGGTGRRIRPRPLLLPWVRRRK
jgi:hypothetical protein